ncbi:5'-nucleotidase, lipoprotein e(P4) family [Chitinophaga sp. RAB17]|uniref:5'-nucleotidase, lipoprotein e(P4) family n=1 Tax=Chitinophaga sp. RAB17 TaxID=3233049 RepID=UPI003F936392
MKNKNYLTLILIVAFFSCRSKVTHRDEGNVMSLLYQQNAAECKALCLQGYNLARQKLYEHVLEVQKVPNHKRIAIVTDLDETALNNSYSNALAYLHDTVVGLTSLQQWWLKGQATAVPGSVCFFKFADSLNVEIYYISNRGDAGNYVAATMENMRNLGFPQATDTSHFLFSNKNRNKEMRRNQVSVTDTILLLLGDNLSDFNVCFDNRTVKDRNVAVMDLESEFGNRYIIFPNAVYGGWEDALYKDIKNPSLSQRDSIRRLLLDTIPFVKPEQCLKKVSNH